MKVNDLLQWAGAGFIILGHTLNSIGPSVYPWNIVVFALGTILFLVWAIRVANKPQMIVNAIGITVCFAGLVKAFG